MARLIVKDVVVRDREVEVPDHCPGCGADLTLPGAVEFDDGEGNRHHGRLGGGGISALATSRLTRSCRGEFGLEATVSTSFGCNACLRPVASGSLKEDLIARPVGAVAAEAP
jgi:hypothetical protein